MADVTLKLTIGAFSVEVTGPQEYAEGKFNDLVAQYLSGDKSPSPAGSPTAAGVDAAGKKKSAGEFVNDANPQNQLDLGMLLGYYLEHFQDLAAFTTTELGVLAREVRRPFGNPSDVVGKLAARGLMMSAGDKDNHRAYAITASGEDYVKSLTSPAPHSFHTVDEILYRLMREVDALKSALGGSPTTIATDAPILRRIQDLVSSWLTTAHPALRAIGINPVLLDQTDGICFSLTRLTSKASLRTEFAEALTVLGHFLFNVQHEYESIPLGRRQLTGTPSTSLLLAEVADLPNQLVPNSLQGWIPQIKAFLQRNDFDRNVFIMVAYRTQLAPLIRRVSRVLIDLNLNPIVARDHRITDDLYNPIACLLCCSYGVAIFDRPEASQRHNPNVVYELGMMQLLKRNCMILKSRRLRRMPSDLLAKLYEPYESPDDAEERIREWWTRSNVS